MDLSWATQESEAVAEKVLRYRRDASGWKKCREGVSEGLGGKRGLETAPKGLESSKLPGFSSPRDYPHPGPQRWVERLIPLRVDALWDSWRSLPLSFRNPLKVI